MLAEPMTAFTDYVLALVGFVLGWRLWRASEGQQSRRLFAAALVATAIAALVGGAIHGFAPVVGDEGRRWLWSLAFTAIVAGNFTILAGCFRASMRVHPARFVWTFLLLRAVISEAILLVMREFRFVVYDYVATLLVLGLIALWRRRDPAAGWLLAAVAVSLAGVIVQYCRFALDPGFNHNDLFHVLQTVGVWLFYRAAMRLRDYADVRSGAA